MLRIQKIVLIVSELLFPILGYVFWSWNIYDISLFYVLDLMVTLFVFIYLNLKYRQIFNFKNFRKIVLILLLHLSIFTLSYAFFKTNDENFNLVQSVGHFLFLKDVGLPQVYLLLPLIFLMFITEEKKNKMKIIQDENSGKLYNQDFIIKKSVFTVFGIAILFGIELIYHLESQGLLIYLLLCVLFFMTLESYIKIKD
ncbi:MAG: hypothetical protein HYU67_11290 [Flavobacteriia bacterium]|nr:hypothetical protein [Flavobacteriia bacterium]